jgi:hypothetical protein
MSKFADVRARLLIGPLAVILLSGFAIVLSGCSESPGLQPGGDAAAAKEALTTALDAWKGGEDPKSLQSGEQAFWVTDEDWKSGKKLTDYRIAEEVEQSGGHWRVCAELTMADSGQASRPEKICYAVTIAEAISIIRSDFLY